MAAVHRTRFAPAHVIFNHAERRASRGETLQTDEAAVRVLPMGRQEAADWASALDIVVNRLVTIELTVREKS